MTEPGKKEIRAESADGEQSNGEAVVKRRPKYDLCLAGFFHAPIIVMPTLGFCNQADSRDAAAVSPYAISPEHRASSHSVPNAIHPPAGVPVVEAN